MSGDSSLLVEKLWRLKRRIDKGACPGVEFVHLNTLLREPAYRADVLRRVELSGKPELQALAKEIQLSDNGQPLMAKETTARFEATEEPRTAQKSWLRRNSLIVFPVLAIGSTKVRGLFAKRPTCDLPCFSRCGSHQLCLGGARATIRWPRSMLHWRPNLSPRFLQVITINVSATPTTKC